MGLQRFKVAVLLASLLFLLALQPVIAQAETRKLTDDVNITLNKVEPSFPTKLQFKFDATPRDGKKYTRIELNYRLVGDVATRVRVKDLSPTDSLVSSFDIDTQKDYIPPGVRVSYYWTLTDSSGKSYDTDSQVFTLKDERFGFRELTSGLVTVRWYEGTDAFGKALLDKATNTMDKLSQEYGIKANSPINIHVYPDQTTFYQALPPNTGEFVGGQAYVEYGAISVKIEPNDFKEIGRSLPHEVSHLVVHQATLNPYNRPPAWLDEGLAVNNQDQVEGFLTEAFQHAIDKNSLQTLRSISFRFPSDSTLFYQSYGESVNVVQFILKKYGKEGMGRLINSFKNGLSYDEALQGSLGVTMDQLDKQWKDSLGYIVAQIPVTTAPVAAISAPQPTRTANPVTVQTTPPATSLTELITGLVNSNSSPNPPVARVENTAPAASPSESPVSEDSPFRLLPALLIGLGVTLMAIAGGVYLATRKR